MALSKQRDICARCGEGPKWIKARRLCESCYMHVRANGTRDQWPRQDQMFRKPGQRGFGMCSCYNPIPQSLRPFGAVQCLKCGKKLPDDY